MEDVMKKVSLGVPLALAGVATVVTAWPRASRAHAFFGAVWTALSLAHAYQYRKKMMQDLFGEVQAKAQTQVVALTSQVATKATARKARAREYIPAPPTRLGTLIRSMHVAFYMPGRIRLYSPSLVDNEALSEQILHVLGGYDVFEIVEIGAVTGSLLLVYDPEKLRKVEELKAIEDYVMKHVVRR